MIKSERQYNYVVRSSDCTVVNNEYSVYLNTPRIEYNPELYVLTVQALGILGPTTKIVEVRATGLNGTFSYDTRTRGATDTLGITYYSGSNYILYGRADTVVSFPNSTEIKFRFYDGTGALITTITNWIMTFSLTPIIKN